ncbi:MAG: VCBS repeat-containing protein [Deltaproteobacteria bacterium]|nr:VCBS repeat-containing protein [Deltaproteobacteria bacterium]
MAPDGTVQVDGLTFSSVRELHQSKYFQTLGLRCGTRSPAKSPSKGVFVASDCSLSQTVIRPEYWPTVTYKVRVVFHVITQDDGATGDVSDAKIAAQIQVMNEDFQALAGTMGAQGFNTKIQFELAGITRTANTNWFGDNDEYGFKSTLRWDPHTYFNIYTNNTVYLGYSTVPAESAGTWEDGVVLNYEAVGGRNNGYETYDQGRTAVHEAGHYFGLEHTFLGGCTNTYTSGDLLVDTNPEAVDHYGCSQTYSCGMADPIHNYMDYTDDTCMYQFTSEQGNRMICSLLSYRPGVYTVVGDAPTPTPTPTPTLVPTPAPLPSQPGGWIPMYRTYNANLAYHFFTTSYGEFTNAVAHGYNDESTGSNSVFYVKQTAEAGTLPIHRLYSVGSGKHYYTYKNAEMASLVALGWLYEHDEGNIYNQATAGTREIYRMYNTVYGTHLYTSSASEVQWILTNLPAWQQNQSLGFALVPGAAAGASLVDQTNLARLAAAQGVSLEGAKAGAALGVSSTTLSPAAGQPGWVLAPTATPAASPGAAAQSAAQGGSLASDFNQDGKGDLLWYDPATGEAVVWLLDGETVLARKTLGRLADPAWTPALVADLDGDGRPEVVWRHGEDGRVAVWFLGDFTPTARNLTGAALDPASRLAAHGDYNGDGKADLLWSDPAGGLTLWLMDGARVQEARALAAAPEGWQSIR